MSGQWWTRNRGRVMGPFTARQVQQMVKSGEVMPYHECTSDHTTWVAVSDVPELNPQDGSRTSRAQRATAVSARPPEPRDEDEYDDRPRRPRREPDPPPPPPRKGVNLYVLLVAGLGGLVLVGGAVTVVLLMLGKPDGGTGVVKRMSDLPMSEQTRLRTETVGLVVTGARVQELNGDWVEEPESTGSGFVVSPSGKVITNKHVVEPHLKMKRQLDDPAVREAIKKKSGATITPKLWVFFGRDEKYECEVVHVSENYDMAILDPRRPAKSYLALCDTPDADIPQLKGLTAVGFPGNDRKARQVLEGGVKPNALRSPSVQHAFEEADYIQSVDTGDVRKKPSPIKMEGIPTAYYLLHGAPIIHGNSGGPLLASDGTVVGINTIGRPVVVLDAKGDPVVINQVGQNYALTLHQLKTEISRHVPDAVWRRHPE